MRKLLVYIVSWSFSCLGFSQVKTPIRYKYENSASTFETNYSLESKNTESFILDVIRQGSLGTFSKSTVFHSDEFADAIQKRVAEYKAISLDMRREVASTLPEVQTPSFQVKTLNVNSQTDPSIKLPRSNTVEAVFAYIAEAEKGLSGLDRAKGLNQFISVKTLIESNTSATYFQLATEYIDRIETQYFSNGILKGHALSDMKFISEKASIKGKYILFLLNRCIANSACSTDAFRTLAAHIDMFANGKDLVRTETNIKTQGIYQYDIEDAIADIEAFVGIKKVKGDCLEAVVCEEPKSLHETALKQRYNLSSLLTQKIISRIYAK